MDLAKLWRGRTWDGRGWVTMSYREWVRELGSSSAVDRAIRQEHLDDVTGDVEVEDAPPFV